MQPCATNAKSIEINCVLISLLFQYNSMQRRLMQGAREQNARHNQGRYDEDDDRDQAEADLRHQDRESGRKLLDAFKLLSEANDIEPCLTFLRDDYPAILLLNFTPGLLGGNNITTQYDERNLLDAKEYLQASNTRQRFMRIWTNEFPQRPSYLVLSNHTVLGAKRHDKICETLQRLSEAPEQDFLISLPYRRRIDRQDADLSSNGRYIRAYDWENIVKYLEEYLASLHEAIGAHFRD